MTAKHTPGPWKACLNGECECGYVFGDGGDVYVARALGPGDEEDPRPTREMQKANARLIAAAPDLLAAAEAALWALEKADCWCGPGYTCLKCRVIDQVKTAIAKAKGVEQQ